MSHLNFNILYVLASILGFVNFAAMANVNSSHLIPLNGIGGGGEVGGGVVGGGTQTVSITSTVGTTFTLNYNIMCNGATDRINCTAFVFNTLDGAMLTPITLQGICAASVFSGTFTTPQNSCVTGTEYNLNFFCINQTTQSATAWTSGTNASFTCA